MLLDAADEAAAVEMLHDLGCTDGLPVIVPTRERVGAMLGGRTDTADIVATVPPRMGQLSVHDVAVNAVMAGCSPAHLPIVLAAVRAVTDPAFALGVVQATTHNAGVLTIVSGPIRHVDPPVASGAGALGPGHRANASIGRAVRLVLINAGGAHAGTSDMSTLGQPAKLTCCVAEAEEISPFAPLVSGSAVTAIAVEGPSQVMFVPVGDSPAADAARLLELLAATLAVPGALTALGYSGSGAIALCPLHAQVLAGAGHDRATIQQAVYDRAQHPAGEIRRRHGFVRGWSDATPDTAAVPVLASPAHLLVFVAGGAGTYSAVFAGLARGVGGPVTVAI